MEIELHETARTLETLERKAGCRMPSASIKKRLKGAYLSDTEKLSDKVDNSAARLPAIQMKLNG